MMRFFVYGFLFLATVFPIAAQAQFEDRLTQLERTYVREVEKATAPIDRRYYNRLVELQKALIDQNELERALAVKKEIDALLSKKTDSAPVTTAPPKMTEAPARPALGEPEEEADDDWGIREWGGDVKRRRDGNDSVLLIEGAEGGTRKMSREIDVAEEFPNGVRMRFQYKSEGLPGGGLEIRGDHPSAGFTYRNPTLTYDGQWREYEWPFMDYKGDETIVFEFHVENTDGEIIFKEIEFLKP